MAQCEALRKDGTPCKANALPENCFCFFHSQNEEHLRQRQEGRSRGGVVARKGSTVLPNDLPDVQLQSPADVTALLARTVSQLLRGEIAPRIANAIGFLATTTLTAMQQQGGTVSTRVEFLVVPPTEPVPVDPEAKRPQ